MKAQILYGIGNIKFTEIATPAPKAGEALIKVSSCGICGSDIPRIYKTGAHNMPLIPGHEFAGIIEGFGDDISRVEDDSVCDSTSDNSSANLSTSSSSSDFQLINIKRIL